MSNEQKNGLKTIFERYGCKDTKELYLRVKQGQEGVQELSDHIEQMKKDIPEYRMICNHDYKYASYLMTQEMPKDKEILVSFANAAYGILDSSILDMNSHESLQNVLRVAMKTRAINAFFCAGRQITSSEIQTIEDALNDLRIKVADQVRYDSKFKTIQLRHVTVDYDYDETNTVVPDYIAYMQQPGYVDFIKFYTQKELIGKDIDNDKRTITDLIKVRQQALDVEHVESISVSSDNKILRIDTTGIGGVDQAYVDHRNIFHDAFQHQNISGLILTHNHPSGTAEGSHADEDFTLQIDSMAKRLGIKIYDSLVVTMNKVISVKQQLGLVAWLESDRVREQTSEYKKHKVASCHLEKTDKTRKGIER